MQLSAALEYVKTHPVIEDTNDLEETCGVGVVVTDEQIRIAVQSNVQGDLGKIKTLRYRFVTALSCFSSSILFFFGFPILNPEDPDFSFPTHDNN